MSYEPEITPDPERFPNIKGRDEIVAGIAKFRRAQGTPAEAEVAEELAWEISDHAYATYGRPMAYRHKGAVYRFDETEGEEGCRELTLVVLEPGEIDGYPLGFEVVDIPDDPTFAMN